VFENYVSFLWICDSAFLLRFFTSILVQKPPRNLLTVFLSIPTNLLISFRFGINHTHTHIPTNRAQSCVPCPRHNPQLNMCAKHGLFNCKWCNEIVDGVCRHFLSNCKWCSSFVEPTTAATSPPTGLTEQPYGTCQHDLIDCRVCDISYLLTPCQTLPANQHQLVCGHIVRTDKDYESCGPNCKVAGGCETAFFCQNCTESWLKIRAVKRKSNLFRVWEQWNPHDADTTFRHYCNAQMASFWSKNDYHDYMYFAMRDRTTEPVCSGPSSANSDNLAGILNVMSLDPEVAQDKTLNSNLDEITQILSSLDMNGNPSNPEGVTNSMSSMALD
jgi:hypothetical protein